MEYPHQITFDPPGFLAGFTKEIQDFINRLISEMKMTKLSENVLQIDYPQEIVSQIRTVNVDDCIYRLDIVFKGHEGHRFCFFPHAGWTRENFFQNDRFMNVIRTPEKNRLTLTYPKLKKRA